jgi:hypothetical protein
MFANRRLALGEGPGIVLEVEAKSDMIVADLKQTRSSGHTSWLGEHEHILDPRLVRDVRTR